MQGKRRGGGERRSRVLASNPVRHAGGGSAGMEGEGRTGATELRLECLGYIAPPEL